MNKTNTQVIRKGKMIKKANKHVKDKGQINSNQKEHIKKKEMSAFPTDHEVADYGR